MPLLLRGVRENNLQNLSLTLPHDRFVVITGVSGSGKSSLAFDTIYAEGGRRYLETFNLYTRQFLDRLRQPDLDSIAGVRPALALEQRNRTTSSRSTVGTITELNDYLKILWPELATLFCPTCGVEVVRHRPATVMQRVRERQAHRVLVAFPISFQPGTTGEAIRATLEAQGFLRYFDGRAIRRIEELGPPPDVLDVVVDRLTSSGDDLQRFLSSVTQAFHFGRGTMEIFFLGADDELLGCERFSEDLRCERCERRFSPIHASHFSFNNPIGACPKCQGFGRILEIDPERCIREPQKSIREGAVSCWTTRATAGCFRSLKKFCARVDIDVDTPWKDLPARHRSAVLKGERRGFRGVLGWFDQLHRKRHQMHVRVFLSRYRHEVLCPECNGSRLRPEALNYRIAGKTLPDIWQLPVTRLAEFIDRQISAGGHSEFDALSIALEEIRSRLRYLIQVGLPYLTLDRQTKTLSGGESQRVNLTAILGSRLVNTTLVLDEPTIGLHARDTGRLVSTLREIQQRGNSLFIVEHDSRVIRSADEVVDLGPAAGHRGGTVVYQGDTAGLLAEERSVTGRYLGGKLAVSETVEHSPPSGYLHLHGARANNLRAIDVTIPLGQLVVVTGVSGSGKSSLVRDCLYNGYRARRDNLNVSEELVREIEGLEALEEVVFVDQNPIGKTPRSNPGTYTGVWELLRECLADTEEARRLGLGRAAFSFNVDGGRCPECKGAGYHRIEMQFLADVFVQCELCRGTRFKDQVLAIRYAGKNVRDLLDLTLEEVQELISSREADAAREKITALLAPLLELGLGYLRLGQPLSELSGGEAQRMKLASYLGSSAARRCLFLFDEPTTGLHPANVRSLLAVLRRLIERGHSVLCVEHNLDLIGAADWMIELGPEGGESGGLVVVSGHPRDLVEGGATGSATVDELRQYANERRLPCSPGRRVVPIDTLPRISIVGARHHNLKNVTVGIPREKLVVITGVSGSGKSSLAFDILFQEGQRRYLDCLSPYARQYLTQVTRAEVDRVDSLPPTVAVSQRTAPPLGISTMATVTEVYHFLRLLFCKIGVQHCPEHDLPIVGLSSEAIVEEIARRFGSERLFVFAPVISGRKGYYTDLFERALKAEIEEARIDGKIVKLRSQLRLERHKLHWIALLVGSIQAKNRELLTRAVDQALLLGSGTVEVARGEKGAQPIVFSTDRVCPTCHCGFRTLDPQDFSFRSGRGVCHQCQGSGRIVHSLRDRVCPECKGARIGALGRHVYLDGRGIHDLATCTAPELLAALEQMAFPDRLRTVVQPVLSELRHRLEVISAVGLDYLSLDRDSSTLSGGEGQRLRLARSLGSPLSGVCYVLDEPTIGLHPRDHAQLMQILIRLRDSGNTVVVVEHDEQTIMKADHVIDIGPGGGAAGGFVVASGSVEELIESEQSLTGRELRRRIAFPSSELASGVRPEKGQSISIRGATANNLRSVSVRIPLNALTVVCGVSGAGKSSLVHGTVVPAVTALFAGESKGPTWRSISGSDSLDRVIEIDQRPVGKSITSTPASFLGVLDTIRKIFAHLPEARARGWSASHFSFNSGKGRCGMCRGKGVIRIPMSFLPDATAICEQCSGSRYEEETLSVRYQGLSIGDVLQRTISEAMEIFANHSAVRRALSCADALGLGYLTLGQPTSTLSGGEVQRLKVARELGARESVDTLYIFDEPTIGLHMCDVDRLRRVFGRLIERGNTVVVIEHDLDIIRSADYLIELGPGPGDRGGLIIFAGSPAELAVSGIDSPTRASIVGEKERDKRSTEKLNAQARGLRRLSNDTGVRA